MKLTVSAAALSLAFAAVGLPALASDEHKIIRSDQIRWSPGPPSLAKGAEFAVLSGDPSKDGPFVMRLKLPKGFQIAPHSHSKPEVVTVLSGTFRIGMGETVDPSKASPLPAGGFFTFPPGRTHFASMDEDTIVQLNSTGPWTVNYVNPKDDPRQKTQ